MHLACQTMTRVTYESREVGDHTLPEGGIKIMSVAPAGCNSCLPSRASPAMRQTRLPGVGPKTPPCAGLVANPDCRRKGVCSGRPRRKCLPSRSNNNAGFVTHITGSRTARREHCLGCTGHPLELVMARTLRRHVADEWPLSLAGLGPLILGAYFLFERSVEGITIMLGLVRSLTASAAIEQRS